MTTSRLFAVGLLAGLTMFLAFVVADAQAADCSGSWDPQTCAAVNENTSAVLEVRDALAVPLAERDPDAHDLLELVAWGTLLSFGGILFLIVSPILSAAFRWWADL